MYHIPNDARAQRSAERIYESLLQTLFRFSMTDILFRVHMGHIEEIEMYFFHDMRLSRIQMEYLATTLSALLSAGFGLWCRHPQTTPEEMLASFRAALHHLDIMFGIQRQ